MSRRELKKRPNFTKEEILIIINIWSEDKFQRKFRNSMKHKLIWDEIAGALTQFGYFRSGHELHNKINNLKGEYRRLKLLSEEALLAWPYYNGLNKILNKRNSNIDDSINTTENEPEESSYAEHDYSVDSNSNSMDIEYKYTIPVNLEYIDKQNENEITKTPIFKPSNQSEMKQEKSAKAESLQSSNPNIPKPASPAPQTRSSTPASTSRIKFRRRPLRRASSQPTHHRLMHTLLTIGNRYIDRLEERDRRIADRQDRIVDSMCKFLDSCSQFLNQNGTSLANIFAPKTSNADLATTTENGLTTNGQTQT